MRAATLLLAALSLSPLACVPTAAPPQHFGDEPRRIAVALEEEGAVALVSATSGELLGKLSLEDAGLHYHVHNVQGAPDGRMVWATALPDDHSGTGEGHEGMSMEDEQLIGIDTVDFAVVKRIPLGPMLHSAHVVTDGSTAWVSAKDGNTVLEVDLEAGEVTRSFELPAGTGPHGVRRTPDGTRLILAGWDGHSLGVLDLESGTTTVHDVGGIAVQSAVLPDGSAAFVTVYDTKQVARLDLVTNELVRFDLPAGAAGPVQLYPTPDSTGIWVADQGFVDGDPAGDSLYRLDAVTGETTLTAKVSPAPHGVVLSSDGTEVWTTTLHDGTVDRVDARTGERVSVTPVGAGPNGISCLHEDGAMP